MIQLLFWLSLGGLFYIYLGYPLLVRILSAIRPLRWQKSLPAQAATPANRVSIVIASYNDAPRLAVKLKELLNSAQASWIGEILIGSDGSTDETADVVVQLGDSRVQLHHFAERRGKPAILNELLPQCRYDIIVLCDARQILSPDAVPQLVANFADAGVGVVSGELIFRTSSGETLAGRGVSAYWRYEKYIRKCEARFRSVPGATGALYAIRKSVFRPIPISTLLDDVVIPMQAIAQGFRCVFEPNAIAWDDPSATLEKEVVRKRRTIAGAAQLMSQHPAWLLPWKNPIWLEYVSHKLLRLTSPLLLVTLMIANLALAHQPVYWGLLILHLAFYATAGLGWLCQQVGRPSLLFAVQLMFLSLNATTVAALYDAVRGRYRVTWQRT